LTGAIRVAAGPIAHRAFYTPYGPGQFYILAGLFNAFGQTVLVERLYDAAVSGRSSLMTKSRKKFDAAFKAATVPELARPASLMPVTVCFAKAARGSQTRGRLGAASSWPAAKRSPPGLHCHITENANLPRPGRLQGENAVAELRLQNHHAIDTLPSVGRPTGR
jgi:hypothetical protein